MAFKQQRVSALKESLDAALVFAKESRKPAFIELSGAFGTVTQERPAWPGVFLLVDTDGTGFVFTLTEEEGKEPRPR